MDNKNNSTVSVIVPTHNRPDELKEALQSVYNQSLLPDEIIVVDDGSTTAITRENIPGPPFGVKLIILRNEKAKGANNARNRGIKEACGEWIAFLDDDDEFFPEKIERVKKVIEKHGDAIDLIYHPARINMVDEGVHYFSKPKLFRAEDDVFKGMLVKNHIGGLSMAIGKKSFLMQIGLFDENMPALEDYELWLRMAKKWGKMFFLNESLTSYNHATEKRSLSKDIKRIENALSYIEEKYSSDYALLSKEKMSAHQEWKAEMLIHKAYLNKDIFGAVRLNMIAFLRFWKAKYLFATVVSVFGASMIFRLRASLGDKLRT